MPKSDVDPESRDAPEELTQREKLIRDFMASTVVFLVALPLCIGIAVACGVPVERGLIAGIIGGSIGVISGAPLLVSGPAASLIVPCFALVSEYGLVALGPVVMLTGVWQILAGYFRLGQWFRAVAPAVITGMLTGIGVLIIGSQSLVAIDEDPKATFIQNVAAVPLALYEMATGSAGHSSAPFWIAVATVALIVGWNQFKPKVLAIVPGHLVALLSVTAASVILSLDVRALDISSNFFAGLGIPSLADLELLSDPVLIGRSAMFAFVASAATLLTANAIDERQTIVKTDYDKEMRAQGVGNLFSGMLGGLPMTGVIVRSSVNVEAGAQTKRATIFHAIWLLLFCALAPELLGLIPKACLGAILVYTGVKLVDVGAMGRLWEQGRAEFVIFGVTFIGVVFIDLFIGILAGLAAAVLKIVWTFSHLEIHQEDGPAPGVVQMHLVGSATFVQLPRLARALESIPTDKELHVHIERLDHIDHACLQLLSSMQRQRESAGQPGVHVAWQELSDRYRKALVGTGAVDAQRSMPSIVRMVWSEWKRVHAEVEAHTPSDAARWNDWIPAQSIHVHSSARTLEDVLGLAAPRLAKLTGLEPGRVLDALTATSDGHVPLGDGVSLPHAAVEGIERSQVVVVTTKAPIAIGDHKTDIFFVLLSPAGDTAEHLRNLAHIGRMCHRAPRLDELRHAPAAETAATVLDALSRAAARGETLSGVSRSLVIIAGQDAAHAHELRAELSEAFAHWTLISEKDHEILDLLRRCAASPDAGAVLVASIKLHEEPLLRALLEEANKLNKAPAKVVFMREQGSPQVYAQAS
ncbi:SulP family inorganic anion transporter [Enhygromyxa salina]|uniref:Bicarbonate transporter BicA n=1 Tax=Enhygromyxa salina TaxID=215803 RepID=A0A2S9Y3H1_9BACT|nr:SulP family inorganic anion transporter [Enhygromyxa salina]PRP99648.1 Bicarbonate transporter BicA [Enhygromyxa salina]